MVEKIVQPPSGYTAPFFQWDEKKVSKKIEIFEDKLTCKVKEGSGFKTVLGTTVAIALIYFYQPFTAGGSYYFEIFLEKGYLLKIGISRDNINYEEAFSDSVKGWAIYNGEVRHNSNSSGKKYGSCLAVGDTVGVALDMIKGTLSFYRNGEFWGIAFQEEELKTGEFFPACAPIYNQDQFRLRMLIRED